MEFTIDQALQKAVAAHKSGQIQEADRFYTAILKVEPKHPDANHNLGVLAVSVGKVETALPFFKTALEANPTIEQFWLSYIDALINLDRLADAKAVYDQAMSNGAKGNGFDKLELRLNEISKKPLTADETSPEAPEDKPNIIESLKLDQAIKLAKKKAKDGSPQEAKRIYQDILTKYPKNKIARAELRRLAGGTFSKASEAQDLLKDQIQSLMALYKEGQLALVIQHAEVLTKQYPKSFDVWNLFGASAAQIGQLDKAIFALKKVLAIKPHHVDANNNMGVALQEQGKLDEAIKYYIKALAIKADYAEAHNNMGICLQEQGKLAEAVAAYNKALAIKADYAEAHNNIGICLQEQGKLEEALASYKKALVIKADYADAHNNMGVTFFKQGKLEEAIEAYRKALSIRPEYNDAYQNIGNALRGIIFKQSKPDVLKIIASLLDKKFIRPAQIARSAISLLKLEPALMRHLQNPPFLDIDNNLIDVVSDLSELPVLLKLMSICPLIDLELEKLLTKLRSGLLFAIADINGLTEVLKFQSALALQCFTNEYLYIQNDDEDKTLSALELKVKQTISNGDQPSPQSVLCLAAYKPLVFYDWSSSLVITDEIKEVFKRQVVEPNVEANLKSTIPVLADITNEVSSNVRDQYEVSPYPRWVNLGLSLKPAPISKVVEEIKLKLSDDQITKVDAPQILIAGCGTGQHSIETAARFKRAKVLAIDLSLSSLSYAKRKTKELGVNNIEYMQADILNLAKLGRQFDIVESVGVLHHMDDPVTGWRAITDCLKPGGLMKIGLYSEIARQHVLEMRKEIGASGIGSGNMAMKSFRNIVINSDLNHHRQIRNVPDFYSLSELKDLLFHVQEHRFTIPQIQDYLSELRLQFCGFEGDKMISHFNLTNTNKHDPYDLDKWKAYEASNPSAFFGMYQFWCQKMTKSKNI